MTKNHKSSLFSNRSSRRSEKRAPRGTILRLEALENRELLSVNPTDGALAYDTATLAEPYGAIALPGINDGTESTYVSAATLDLSPQTSVVAEASALQSAAYLESSYAVIFIGATDGARSYNAVKTIYDVLSDNMRFAPENIYILFGDASAQTGFDWDFAENVEDANYENLNALLGRLDRMMNEDSNLLFITTDNGEVNQTFYCDRGETITGAQMRDALYQIQSGYVSCFFPKRDIGDAVEALFNPETGEIYGEYANAQGEQVVYGGSAVFSYEAVYSVKLPGAEPETAESRLVVSYSKDADSGAAENSSVYSLEDGEYVIAEGGIGYVFDKYVVKNLNKAGKKIENVGKKVGNFVDKVLPGSMDLVNSVIHFVRGEHKEAWNDLWQNKWKIGGAIIGGYFGQYKGAALGYTIGSALDGDISWGQIIGMIISSLGKSTDQSLAAAAAKAIIVCIISPTPPTSASISVNSMLGSGRGVVLNLEKVNANYQAASVGYRVSGTSDWKWISVAGKTGSSGSNTTFTLENLELGTQYDICSKIVINTSAGPLELFSKNCCITTPKAVVAPQIDEVVKETSTQLNVSWTPKDDLHTTGYVVSYTNMTTDETLTVNASRSDVSVVLKELQEGTKYRIQVKAKGDFGVGISGGCVDSDWTTTYVTTPKTLSLAPIKATRYSNDLLSAVEWLPPSEGADHVSSYELQYRLTGSEDAWTTVTRTENNSPNLPSGHYEFRYRALLKDEVYWSPWSASFFTQVAKRQLVKTPGSTSDSFLYALNNLDDGDLIIFDEKMKGQTITLPSTLTISRSVTIDASRCLNADGTPGVTIDASLGLFKFTADAANIEINGLKIINSRNDAAIYTEGENLTVTNCVFENNSGSLGGAIFSWGQNLTVTNSVFKNNYASLGGGAIYIAGNGDAEQRLTVTNSVFENNSTGFDCYGEEEQRFGGAIFSGGPVLTVTNSVFENNHATHGGAIYQAPSYEVRNHHLFRYEGTVSIDSSQFIGNYASGDVYTWQEIWDYNWETGEECLLSSGYEYEYSFGDGGALYLEDSMTTITNTDFRDNWAFNDGGALFVWGNAWEESLSMVRTSFYENSAEDGGAIYAAFVSLTVDSGIFYGNDAYYAGVAYLTASQCSVTNALIYGNCGYFDEFLLRSSSALSLRDSTVADNQGRRIVNIFGSSSVDVVNSILLPSDNQPNGVFYYSNDPQQSTVTGTNVLSTDSSEWNTPPTNFWTYDPSKPLFTDAANGDYTLALNSQALNRGGDYYATADEGVVDGWRDLAGAPRQVGGRVDLGAYETQEYETRAWTVTSPLDALNEGTLRFALMNAHEGDVVLFDESLRGGTITLNSELPIMEGITIDATNLYDARNARPGLTISGVGASRVFNVWKDAGDVTIKGLTIANGVADDGGGIYKGVNSTLTLESCVVEYNIAETGSGGGVYAEGGELKIVDSAFRSNRTWSTADDNGTKGFGGALYVKECATTVASSTFVVNRSMLDAAAIFANNSRLDVESSTFTQNTADRGQSAIKWYAGSSGSVVGSLFYRNTSGTGSVFELSTTEASSGSEVTIENSTIVNNVATGKYGALPALSLRSATTNQPGTYNVVNSIVAFNGGSGMYGSNGTPLGAQTFNVSSTLADQSVDATNGNINYTGSIAALFTNAANDDYTLAPNSAAVNAGSNAYVTTERDLSGASRIQAGRVDLGAFERLESRTIVVKSSSDDASDEESLRYAVNNARHGDYIVFSGALQGKTITLTSPLVLTKTVTIDATHFVFDVSSVNAAESDAPANEYSATGLALDGAGLTKLISVVAEDQTVALKGLFFANGLAGSSTSPAILADGGTVENVAGELTLSQCVFVDNRGFFGAALRNGATTTVEGCEFVRNEAYYGGGAIFNTSGASLTVVDSKFDGNVADAYVDANTNDFESNVGERYGGAIMNYGGWLEIEGSEFLNNETHGEEGGAIYNYKGSIVVRDSRFNANYSAQVGGAIMNYKGEVSISGSELSENVAYNGGFKDPELGETTSLPAGGGAIFNYGGTLTVDSSRLARNSSDNYYGGAIYSLDATLTISNSTLSDNRAGVSENGEYIEGSGTNLGAGRGGAIFVHSKRAAYYSNATITNSIIVRNNAGYGGGVFVQNANVELRNTDVAYNVSKFEAGGVVVDTDPVWADGGATGATLAYSTVNAYNSIVVMNESVAKDGFSDVYKGTVDSVLNAYGTLSGWNPSEDAWTVGGRDFYFLENGPLFVDPENDDFRLTVDSQAINRGVEYADMPEYDLEGAARIVNGRVDLGPYESQTARTPQVIPVTKSTSISDPRVQGTLAYALATAQYGDTIVFDEDSFKDQGKTISLQTEFVVSQSITIDASAIYNAETNEPGITISGGGRTRIFRIDPLAGSVKIIGVKFANGKTTQTSNTQSGDRYRGGAIYAEDVNLTLENCVFENNAGTAYGGAIYAEYHEPGKEIVVENVQFINNSVKSGSVSIDGVYATRALGGALCIASAQESFVNLLVTDSVFYNNSTDNSAAHKTGGAIYTYRVDGEIERSVFKKNSSSNVGAITVDRGEWTVSNSIIAENTGAAFHAYSKGTDAEATLRLYNSTVVGNVSVLKNGAIVVEAYDGGKSRFEAYNSIVAYNAEGYASVNARDVVTEALSGGVVETVARNVMTSYAGWSDGIGLVSSQDYDLNVVFFMPDEHDDSGIPEYYLTELSPARDRTPSGELDASYYNAFVDSAIDLRGGARIQDGKVDMGAYEYGYNVEDFSKISPRLPAMSVVGDLTTGSTVEIKWSSGVAPTAEYQWLRADADAENWTVIEGATSAKYTFTLADAGRRVKVTATPTGYFVGAAQSSPSTGIVLAQLDSPGLNATETAPTSITVRYEEIERAEGYRVAYKPVGAKEWTVVDYPSSGALASAVLEGSETSSSVFKIVGLAPNTSYEIRVATLGNATSVFDSEYSETLVATTGDDTILLREIAGDFMLGGTVTAVLARDCAATWQWYRTTEQGDWSAIAGATSADYSITSADLGCLLRVDVSAVGTDGYQGSDSQTSRGPVWTTLAAPTLTVESTTSDSISLRWSEIANAAGYQLLFHEEGSDDWYCIDELTDEDGCTIEGFEPETRYEFQIMAVGDGLVYDSSPYSESVMASPGDSPFAVTSYDAETRVATIEWGAISGASKYTVKISKDGGATWTNYKTNLTTTSVSVNGLYAGKEYAFRVIGIASDGTQLGGVSEIAFAPVSATSSIQDYTVGTPITLKLSASANASATIQWYFVTNEGDVEIVSARDQLTYTPTSADYDIKVVTTGTGNSAPCVYTQTISRPIDAAPITVRSYDAETRIATIRWDPMPDAATYTVKISKDGGATWLDYIKKIPSKNNYKGINGIYAGRSYDFRVYGITSDGTALERYAAGTVAPVTLNLPPNASTTYSVGEAITVRQTGADNASATIKWYSVTPTKDVEIVSARNQLTYTPTTADYDIKVVATGTGDSKGCNSTLTFTAPEAISVTSYDASTRVATLEWLPIAGATKYTVKLSKDDGATWTNYKTNVTTTSTTVNGLYVGKTYGFQVYGFDSTGAVLETVIEGNFAPISISSSTTSYSVGTAIVVAKAGSENSSATIQWYESTPGGDVEIVSARGQLSYTPTRADYDIKVVATGTGDSKGSNSTLTFTAPEAPEEPEAISVTSYDASTRVATLKWFPIAGATKYTVKISKNDGATWTNYKTGVTTDETTVNGLYVGKTYGFRVYGLDSAGTQVGDYLELTFAPTSDSSALLDEFFADYFEEELFEEVF